MKVLADGSWQQRWKATMQDMAVRSDRDYWNRRAEDYNDFITTSSFDYGHRMVSILKAEGILQAGTHVLEIASGVGAVTLPLAKACGKVTAVEPAKRMAAFLKKNAATERLQNLDITVTDFASFSSESVDKRYDVSFLCHAAWQFPDIVFLIKEMQRLTQSYCCLADTMGSGDAENTLMHQKLKISTPDVDRALHLYNILIEMGLEAKIRCFEHLMQRSDRSARAMWRNLLSKYRTPEHGDLKIIDEHVAARARNGIYEVPGTMAVIWWEVR